MSEKRSFKKKMQTKDVFDQSKSPSRGPRKKGEEQYRTSLQEEITAETEMTHDKTD